MKKEVCYTTYDGKEMSIFLYFEEKEQKQYPLFVHFFGGGWLGGSITCFESQALALAKLGYMVAIVDYRVYNRHQTTVDVAMKDAYYALKFLSEQKKELSIDADNVFLAGNSAGGHLAISCVVLNNVKHEFTIKGVALLNGVVDTTQTGYQSVAITEQPFQPIIFSPVHHLREKLPPVLLLHGTADSVVPYANAQRFVEVSQALGNEATLIPYEGRDHGFFNISPTTKEEDHFDTLEKVVEFVARHTN